MTRTSNQGFSRFLSLRPAELYSYNVLSRHYLLAFPFGLAPPFSYHSSHSSPCSSAPSLSSRRCRRSDLARKTLIVRKSKAKKERPENHGVVAAGFQESPCRTIGFLLIGNPVIQWPAYIFPGRLHRPAGVTTTKAIS